MPDKDIVWDAIDYAVEHEQELRDWVIKNKNYGGAGALNGPVVEKTREAREKMICNHMIRRAMELLRETNNA